MCVRHSKVRVYSKRLRGSEYPTERTTQRITMIFSDKESNDGRQCGGPYKTKVHENCCHRTIKFYMNQLLMILNNLFDNS
jgi:hypothetical protein